MQKKKEDNSKVDAPTGLAIDLVNGTKKFAELEKMGLVTRNREGIIVVIDNSIKVGGSINQSAVNTGDNVTQTVNIQQGVSEEVFVNLFKEIDKIQDESKRTMANFIAEQLKEAHAKKDKSKAKTAIDALKTTIGVTASLATIAKFFGLTI
ncbi:hypothetical protein [Bacillus sp. TH25]|uniref:hypothetical protein n=1 Tax=Bacillus sp. TH25 TaxID=2796391 RepID=UPI0019127AAA|nr:hypothetical protein [Bacillus sp. TH25]MBK5432009.1 hypothetical protein [Bacillus sp. TH25]